MNKQYLQEIAKVIEAKIPDNHGFILLTMPFYGDTGNRLSYTANVNREDAIKTLKEFLFQIGESEQWMQHIK